MLKKLSTLYKSIFSNSVKKNKDGLKKGSYWLKKLYKQEKKNVQKKNKKKLSFKGTNNILKQEGKDKQIKNHATKKEKDRQKLVDLVKKSNRCIITISSLFPWDLFPNTITVEESRITFTFRQFLSSQSHSVEIKDISNVFIESSLFFSTLRVVSRTYVKNDITIRHLNRKKAQKVQQTIEGLRTFIENNINTSNYEIDELLAKIEEFQVKNS